MFYIILKKKKNYLYSYNLILVNSCKRFLKKLGVISFNKKIQKFIFLIDLFQFFYLLKNGVYLSIDFKIILMKLVNSFKM